MNILVVGGYGFLGGRLSQYLASFSSNNVTIGSTRDRSYQEIYKNCDYVHINWKDENELEKICRGIDVIVHASGLNAEECTRNPVLAAEVNGIDTGRLIQAAITKNVKRVLYFSTAHVYCSPLKGLITEDTCTTNLHPYATSHRIAEDILRYAHEKKQIEGVVVRLSNSFGAPADPGANCWMLLVNNLCLQAALNKQMIIKSATTQTRNFVPLSEVCRATDHLINLSHRQIGNGVFNVGSGWNPTLIEVSQRIKELASMKGEVYEVYCPNQNLLKSGETNLVYSIEKLLSTGFSPSPDCIDMEINGLIDFCRQNVFSIPFKM